MFRYGIPAIFQDKTVAAPKRETVCRPEEFFTPGTIINNYNHGRPGVVHCKSPGTKIGTKVGTKLGTKKYPTLGTKNIALGTKAFVPKRHATYIDL